VTHAVSTETHLSLITHKDEVGFGIQLWQPDQHVLVQCRCGARYGAEAHRSGRRDRSAYQDTGEALMKAKRKAKRARKSRITLVSLHGELAAMRIEHVAMRSHILDSVLEDSRIMRVALMEYESRHNKLLIEISGKLGHLTERPTAGGFNTICKKFDELAAHIDRALAALYDEKGFLDKLTEPHNPSKDYRDPLLKPETQR
jgi:hypothetical protein